ncbi:YceI family protein [Aestuariibaculum sp. M13]|uniref:YceI family protein n=1 Tax=Aestuariibaculum sp. M13 TaxID=2967132 RepID=UPI002159EFF0|nr:YceI family protein [Aestuariibaculum sp. M13]MCR8669340.1 YceI family protein [Aestuariibaculum sp. M13]
MKKTIKNLAVVALVAFTSFAFANNDVEKKAVKVESSSVVWKGYKVTGSHEGTIALQSGTLSFDGDKLVGGEFVIDMATINTTDLDGEMKGNLDGHLKSDDFFGTEKYPTAKLVFTKVKAKGKNSYAVTGDLTIKGKTAPVTFDISIYGSKATASLKVDRTKYDVRYGSTSFFDDLKDKAIYDEFDLVTDLQF